MSLDKYAHLITCKIWRRNLNKRKYVPRIQLSFSKNEHQNEVVWLIHLKRAVKYQCSDFPRHATLDVPRPWFVLTRRKRRVRNTTLYATSRFLTRRVPIQDSPSVVEYHGPVNSTKLLISRSVQFGWILSHGWQTRPCGQGLVRQGKLWGNKNNIFFIGYRRDQTSLPYRRSWSVAKRYD